MVLLCMTILEQASKHLIWGDVLAVFEYGYLFKVFVDVSYSVQTPLTSFDLWKSELELVSAEERKLGITNTLSRGRVKDKDLIG